MNAAVDAVLDYAEYVRTHKIEFFRQAEWQKRFFAMGAQYAHRLVASANQTGKTTGGAFEYACHLLGEYPEGWNGLTFEHAPLAWCAGVNLQQVAEVTQKSIFGERDGDTFDGSGFVPTEKVISVTWSRQYPQTAETIKVKSRYGVSTHKFKSYSSTGAEKKKAQALAGTTKLDLLLVDEQPPEVAMGQMLQRTMHGKHITPAGPKDVGAVMILYTPELGADAVYNQFRNNPEPHQGFLNVTWDDLEDWIMSEDQKRTILASLPEHERDMRSKGIPMLGGSVVFPVAQKEIEVPPFEIPHHWRVIIGIDFGIGHPFAAAKVAYDPDEDVIYLVNGYKESGALPAQHMVKLRAMGQPNVPVSYPHDGDTREKRSGETLISAYRECGMQKAIKFRNEDGSIFREPGILDMLNRMLSGRFKVFSTVIDFFYEMRLYHRKNGQIVDANDDLISATRYACGLVRQNGVQPGRRDNSKIALQKYYNRLKAIKT